MFSLSERTAHRGSHYTLVGGITNSGSAVGYTPPQTLFKKNACITGTVSSQCVGLRLIDRWLLF